MFRSLFISEGSSGHHSVLDTVPKLVDDETNNELTKDVTEEEVKQVVFHIGGSKALGPDGFPGSLS